MRAHTGAINAQIPAADWYRALVAYEQPNLRRASWQLLNTWDEANHQLMSFRSLKHAQPQGAPRR